MKTGFLRLLKTEQLVTSNHEAFKAYSKVKRIWYYFLTGSLLQGSFSAGFFYPARQSSEQDFVIKIDVDAEYLLPVTMTKDCVHNIEGKFGHLRLLSSCIPKEIVSHDFKSETLANQSEYIPTYLIKGIFQWNVLTKKHYDIGKLRVLHGMIWKKSNDFVEVVDVKATVKKATCQVTWSVFVNENRKVNFTLDLAGLFKTDFQPTVMKEFQKNTTFLIPDELLEYVFVIPKPSLQEKTNDNTTEWSYSFSHIENYIFAKQLTETQRLVHLIFKSIINKNLKHLDEDTITSYTFKTLLFWKCHHLPPEHPYWNETDAGIIAAVRGLFQDFFHHLGTGFLSNYFVPQINVMENFDSALRKKCIEHINRGILPNMSHLIEWSEIKEVIRKVEIGYIVKHRLLNILQASKESNLFK